MYPYTVFIATPYRQKECGGTPFVPLYTWAIPLKSHSSELLSGEVKLPLPLLHPVVLVKGVILLLIIIKTWGSC